jgi:hypothetical protein
MTRKTEKRRAARRKTRITAARAKHRAWQRKLWAMLEHANVDRDIDRFNLLFYNWPVPQELIRFPGAQTRFHLEFSPTVPKVGAIYPGGHMSPIAHPIEFKEIYIDIGGVSRASDQGRPRGPERDRE